MANRYWVGNGGSWSDTAHWSTTSGGSGGASIPSIGDTANFDANSFSTTGQVVTAPSGFDVTNITCSATNNPTLQLSQTGNNVFGSMDWTGMTIADPADINKKIIWQPSIAGTYNLTTGGGSMPNITVNPGAVSGITFQLQDNCTLYSGGVFLVLTFVTTTLALNSFTLTAPYFYNGVGVTVNFGTGGITSSSLISLASGTTVSGTGTTFTVTGGTISVDSTTLSGSSSSDRLTITNNSGSTQTISNSTLSNTILNGTNGFRLVEVVDDGGNDWGDGGGGTGNPTRLYHVKIPPTYVALP